MLIQQYILKNPEIILESLQRHQIKSEEEGKERAQKHIKNLTPQLVLDPETPVGGNTNGDITVVEFIDYRCGYCKRAHSTMKKMMSDDRQILGPQSVTASRAALAIWRTSPEKHAAFHDKIMSMRGSLNEQMIIATAEKIGIDGKELKKVMADKAIDAILAKNFKLAKALDINGTPAFIIGDQLIPGAIDLATLKKMVAKARKN